jgi:hypothetical protein
MRLELRPTAWQFSRLPLIWWPHVNMKVSWLFIKTKKMSHTFYIPRLLYVVCLGCKLQEVKNILLKKNNKNLSDSGFNLIIIFHSLEFHIQGHCFLKMVS